MRYKIRVTLMAFGVLLLVSGGHVGPQSAAPTSRIAALASEPVQPASVTVPGPADPVIVKSTASLNSRGWVDDASALSSAASSAIPDDVLAAYSLAVAAAPSGCHLQESLLAAIGQVESGNLAGRALDADHRVVPAIFGPVLDGKPYQAVPDTDNGQWDGNRSWDRALGPLQLIPSSWRVVGVDMDGDGRRDPQDIDDAAGAAMVYLCAGGRDLATATGVKDAVLSYNHSAAYVAQVLAWKAVYDQSNLGALGTVPIFDAWALPATTAALPEVSAGVALQPTPTTTARPTVKTPVHTTPGTSAAAPIAPVSPTSSASPSAPAASTPSTPASSGPSPADPTPADPTPADPTPADPAPSPGDPTPTCPVPTPVDPVDPTDPTDPTVPVVPLPSESPADPGTTDPTDPCLPLPSTDPSAEASTAP